MAKSVHDDVLDAALNYIKNNSTRMIACSTQPTTYVQASTTYALADTVVNATSFTVANGASGGRKVTATAVAGVTVDSSGTYAHVALVNTASSKLLYVTTGTSQVLTAGNTVDFPAWAITIGDPT
jgi:hypothetical protein